MMSYALVVQHVGKASGVFELVPFDDKLDRLLMVLLVFDGSAVGVEVSLVVAEFVVVVE